MPRRWKKRKPYCRGANYGLVWFEHETGGAAATKLLAEFLQTGCRVPFIVRVPNSQMRKPSPT
jgi:hypothetical protein